MSLRQTYGYNEAARWTVKVRKKDGAIITSLGEQVGEVIRAPRGAIGAVFTCGRASAFEAQDLRDIADAMDKEKS